MEGNSYLNTSPSLNMNTRKSTKATLSPTSIVDVAEPDNSLWEIMASTAHGVDRVRITSDSKSDEDEDDDEDDIVEMAPATTAQLFLA